MAINPADKAKKIVATTIDKTEVPPPTNANTQPAKKKDEDTADVENFGIVRQPWLLTSASLPDKFLEFNINPSSVEFIFNGRGSTTQVTRGRIMHRFKSSNSTGYFDMDVTFTMQTGILLERDGKTTLGHESLFKILQLMNAEMYTEDTNELNIQTLTLNSVIFKNITLSGFLDISALTIAETAEDPFKIDYPLTFNVLKASPSITSLQSLLGTK